MQNKTTEDTANQEKMLVAVADAIIKRKLSVPAVFFLELHKPISGILHIASLFLEPISAPFFGADKVKLLSDLLSKRENIEKLICLIEERNAPR